MLATIVTSGVVQSGSVAAPARTAAPAWRVRTTRGDGLQKLVVMIAPREEECHKKVPCCLEELARITEADGGPVELLGVECGIEWLPARLCRLANTLALRLPLERRLVL